MRTLVVHCHPDPESFNTALFRAACDALRSAGNEVEALDLYAEQFDPVLTLEERRAYVANPGFVEAKVQKHVDALRKAEHLVFVHPTWWYGPPALLKGWLERVWLPGVAFMPPAKKGQITAPGLQHVQRLTVVTTGGAPWWWLKVIGDPHRKLFTRGLRVLMAKKCKVVWLQMHNMNAVDATERSYFLAQVSQRLSRMI